MKVGCMSILLKSDSVKSKFNENYCRRLSIFLDTFCELYKVGVESAICSPDCANLGWVMVDSRGLVTDGKTQFLQLASSHWLVSYRVKWLHSVWTQIHRNSVFYFHETWWLCKFSAIISRKSNNAHIECNIINGNMIASIEILMFGIFLMLFRWLSFCSMLSSGIFICHRNSSFCSVTTFHCAFIDIQLLVGVYVLNKTNSDIIELWRRSFTSI